MVSIGETVMPWPTSVSSKPLSAAPTPPTVLLVEDDPLIAELAASALEGAGYAVTSVSAAEDALGLAVMDVEFDALVTDIGLDGPLDGWQLAEALCEMRPGLPVVYASGSATEDDPRAVSGAAFVSKPYSPLALCGAVSRFVSPSAPRPTLAPQETKPLAAQEVSRPVLRLIA